MEYSLIDALWLTISAMLIVLAVLALIMVSIILVSKLVAKPESKGQVSHQQPLLSEELALDKAALFGQDPLARVASLTALAHASQDQPDKRFEIVAIKKIS